MHLLPVVGMSEVQCETFVAGVREPRHQWRVEVSSTDPVQAHGEQSHPIKSLPSILKHRRPAEIRFQRAEPVPVPKTTASGK